MGCFHSSVNPTEYIFNSNDVLLLKQSWNVIKTHDLQKFGQDVLIECMNKSRLLRQFWTSKMRVDANNYDFSQSESCLKTDLSWRIGLRDYSIQLISIFGQILDVIDDGNNLKTKIQSTNLPQDFFPIDYDLLLIMKESVLETVHKRFQMFNYDFTDEYQQAWDKFLVFLIEYMMKNGNGIRRPTEVIVSPTINNEQSS